MAYRCDICDKKAQRGKKITLIWGLKYRSIRFRKPNIRKTTLIVDGIKTKACVCAKCLKLIKHDRIAKVSTIYTNATKPNQSLNNVA